MNDKNKCLLVVDNDTAILQLVDDIFRHSDFYVYKARDGVDALRRIDSSCVAIDVLLVDTLIPRLNGMELVNAVLSYHPSIKIIFMLGQADDLIDYQEILSRKISYIKKPFTPNVLLQTVREELYMESSTVMQ